MPRPLPRGKMKLKLKSPFVFGRPWFKPWISYLEILRSLLNKAFCRLCATTYKSDRFNVEDVDLLTRNVFVPLCSWTGGYHRLRHLPCAVCRYRQTLVGGVAFAPSVSVSLVHRALPLGGMTTTMLPGFLFAASLLFPLSRTSLS